MKIATWNLERPTKNGHKTPVILQYLQKIDADILVLTETNECIDLGNEYEHYQTNKYEGVNCKKGDRQVSIFSKYPITQHLKTFRTDTSLCVEISTPLGNLIVYGTIIGNFGNRGDQFKNDLDKQLLDFEKYAKSNNFCIIGDLNISFSDNYYFTKEGRSKLKNSFELLGMKILTEQIANNIDHIILSNDFLKHLKFKEGFWNDTENKKERLSDHKGVFVEIFY